MIKPTFDRPGVARPIKSTFYHQGWRLDFLVSSRLGGGAIASLTAPPPVDPSLGLVLSPVESRFVYTQHHNVKSAHEA